ncbi:MAG TPA: STAS domain-containing protein [Opitutaceae bacterium]|nr:STAS domain-containing protein [Opitutaceae bacterium]
MSAFQLQTGDDTARVRLEGELTIEESAALQVALRTALRQPRALEIDPAALTRIDLAALQVLLAAARAARTVRIAAAAPAWTEALARYALDPAFAANS